MTDAVDKTPYNKVHQTDIQLMQHYGFMVSKVVVISLNEQAIRVYQNGKLVNAFWSLQGVLKDQVLQERGGWKLNNRLQSLRQTFRNIALLVS